MASHPYTVRPDRWDPRDVHLAAVEPLHLQPLPPTVDLRPLLPAIIDQDGIGECSAAAGVALLYAVKTKQAQKPPAFSGLFLYYEERLADGDVNVDGGSTLRTTMQTLSSVGCCAEAVWPFDPGKWDVAPLPQATQSAASWKIASFYRLATLADMQACLASGWPFEIAVAVYPELESMEVAASGVLSMPGPNEQPMGGHALLVAGYDMAKQQLLVRNSWGPRWGQAGYFTMPFEYAREPRLVMDAWTAR